MLNAAAALVAIDGAGPGPVTDQLAAALPRAAESLDSGAAGRALESWITTSRAAATATDPNAGQSESEIPRENAASRSCWE